MRYKLDALGNVAETDYGMGMFPGNNIFRRVGEKVDEVLQGEAAQREEMQPARLSGLGASVPGYPDRIYLDAYWPGDQIWDGTKFSPRPGAKKRKGG